MEFKNLKVKENDKLKIVTSSDYNSIFNKDSGFFARWGRTKDEDPTSSVAPEIADIEISTICEGTMTVDGQLNQSCLDFCYKCGNTNGKNMSLETFKKLFKKLTEGNSVLSQIAFGIGSHYLCPDLWDIMDYCRNNEYTTVIPNLTINGQGLTDEDADKFAKYCGAIAVSRYENYDVCYDAVKKLTDKGMTQVNIHMIIAEETKERCLQLIQDVKNDPRLEKLNAVVFLSLKKKGFAVKGYNQMSEADYDIVMDKVVSSGINYGYDSCGFSRFDQYLDRSNHPNKETIRTSMESCCSGAFSSYFDVDGNYYPCSFLEKVGDWKTGMNAIECDNFIDDIWNHDKVKEFAKKAKECIACGKGCHIYEV